MGDREQLERREELAQRAASLAKADPILQRCLYVVLSPFKQVSQS